MKTPTNPVRFTVCAAAGVAGGEGPPMLVAGTVAVAHVVVVDERVSILVGWRRVLVLAVMALASVTGCAQASSSRPGSVAVAAPATSTTNQAPASASPNTAPGTTLAGSGV